MKHLLGLSIASALATSAFASSMAPKQGASLRVTSYAIVASKAVMADDAWRVATVDVLKNKYENAQVFTFDKSIEEVRPALSKLLPQYTAFVVKPQEAGVHFTIAVSNICRQLDDDPYVDTLWGIVIGDSAASAKLLADAQDIKIKSALDCSNIDLKAFQKAWRYTEDHRGIMNTWDASKDTEVQDLPCDTDNTDGVLKRLREDKIQFLCTSGHATQHDWQMGYSGPNMMMVHNPENELIAVNTKRKGYIFDAPTPKVYFANGNCLIGDIPADGKCMALSWMKVGGVKQMMGYTVTTWFGAQGWGALGIFVDAAGSVNATEAFHFTNTSIVETLESYNIPDLRTSHMTEIKQFNQPTTPGMDMWGMQHAKDADVNAKMRTLIGNYHDRDTVSFYGDPAMDARIFPGRYKITPWVMEGDQLSCTITKTAEAPERALWVALPGSYSYHSVTPAAEFAIDNMIRLSAKDFPLGKCVKITVADAKRLGACTK